jgi:hypothetical protein
MALTKDANILSGQNGLLAIVYVAGGRWLARPRSLCLLQGCQNRCRIQALLVSVQIPSIYLDARQVVNRSKACHLLNV